jgi:hypothetical protein
LIKLAVLRKEIDVWKHNDSDLAIKKISTWISSLGSNGKHFRVILRTERGRGCVVIEGYYLNGNMCILNNYFISDLLFKDIQTIKNSHRRQPMRIQGK